MYFKLDCDELPVFLKGAVVISWQQKLRSLINARESGLEEIAIGLETDVPLSQAEVNQYVSNSRLLVPGELVELYRITDGLVIGTHFFIAGIFSTKHGLQRTLAQLNDLFGDIAGQCESHGVSLIIGSNQASGDLLAIDKEGTVVAIWSRDPREADILASSLDEFLDNVCLGSGYLKVFPTDTLWFPLLERLGLIEKS